MAEKGTDDPRFDEIQDEVDTVRRRLPDNPGLDVPDPDVQPVVPAGEDEDVYPDDEGTKPGPPPGDE